jgi:hypothetical protein
VLHSPGTLLLNKDRKLMVLLPKLNPEMLHGLQLNSDISMSNMLLSAPALQKTPHCWANRFNSSLQILLDLDDGILLRFDRSPHQR